MKGGKEEDKIMGPLFPRLHVNDTDKGGPRAPPRNKMALYEQLSIPSDKFNSTASALPLRPHNASTLDPSASSGQEPPVLGKKTIYTARFTGLRKHFRKRIFLQPHQSMLL